MTFLVPWALAALVLVPLIFFFGRKRRGGVQPVAYSDIRLIHAGVGIGKARWVWLPRALWAAAAMAAILAIARPQERNVRREIIAPGIDIVLALDMSTSMLATDFPPDRFEAARAVIGRFVASRSTDRVALVVFAGRAYTQVPLTFDYRAFQEMLATLEPGQIEDGTAIGMGMVEAINRLKASDAKSKVIILLTDGVNNRGRVDPKTAGEIARMKGIRVYTIGMGNRAGGARSILERAFGISPEASMNVDLLQKIAADTGGRYFEAASLQDLSAVYETIGSLEKSEVKLNEYTLVKEWFPQLITLATILFILGWLLDLTWLRKLP